MKQMIAALMITSVAETEPTIADRLIGMPVPMVSRES
jgi:hypothetical protein